MSLAPIVLFVYNRPEHTKKTLQALQNNTLASKSELYIFADAPKNDDAVESVNEVRKLIENVNGFKKVTLIKQQKNKGLANSIIGGVTEIVNQYGKIIVLEDDLVTSPSFLTFMNDALTRYKLEKKVWHISGWNYPIENSGLPDAFLWRTMNCWGWATWADRWSHFDKDTKKLISIFTPAQIKKFNLDGVENFWGQILLNKSNKINTWAVYWYAIIFLNDGLCLNPNISYINNIGLDGSGEHCSEYDSYRSDFIKYIEKPSMPDLFEENKESVQEIKRYILSNRKNIFIRIFRKLKRSII